MSQEQTNNEVETKDVKGEIRKERGLNWAVISLGLIILAMIIGIFLFGNLMPNPNKMNAPTNSSSAPVQK